MSSYVKNITRLLFLLLVAGCSEVIDLKVAEAGGQLIIYGNVTNIREGNFVTVFRTGEAGEPPVPVLGANVTLLDESGRRETFVQADSGRYELPGTVIPRVIGGAYSLEVEVNGRQYVSGPQVMPPNYGRDIVSAELGTQKTISSQGATIDERVINVFNETEFGELPEEFYLRWDIEEAYIYLGTFLPVSHFPRSFAQIECYVINDLNEQRIFLHNGKENRATTIPSRLYVARTVDKSFQALHYFNFTRSSMNKEVYEYWNELDAIVNRQGSIFDVPPAAVEGNIRAVGSDEIVLGIFEVVSAEITRHAVTRNSIPDFFPFDECVKRGDARLELFSVPRDCRQCLIDEGIVEAQCLVCGVLPNSTIFRPYYF